MVNPVQQLLVFKVNSNVNIEELNTIHRNIVDMAKTGIVVLPNNIRLEDVTILLDDGTIEASLSSEFIEKEE